MSSRALKLSGSFSLPLEAVTQAIAILAKRRAGKSYLAMKFVEQLHHAGQQVVVLDPKGDSWGLRFSADGKSPGLPIVIIGGEHGDVKLEPGAGEIVARLIVEDRICAVIDLSELRKHEVATFSTAFLETVYRLKAQEKYRTPLMLVIDEADAIAPQRPMRGEERMLGAAEDIVRRGGQRGIGCMMATQRAAVLNKNVLTQVQMMIALRTIAPQDLDAMNAWIDVHGTAEERKKLMGSLPSLPIGTAWFWSPGWPTADGIFECVQVGRRETHDSGATPKAGERPVELKGRAEVDLAALSTKMQATIERSKATDPKELQKRIAELERGIEELQTRVPVVEAPEVIHTPAVTKIEFLETLNLAQTLTNKLVELSSRVCTVKAGESATRIALAKPLSTPARPQVEPRTRPVRSEGDGADRSIKGAPERILRSLSWWRSAHIDRPTRHQVAFAAGYTVNGHFNNIVGTLRTNGYVEYPGGGRLELTAKGEQAAPPIEIVLTRSALIDAVRDVLGTDSVHARVFDAIVDHGQQITRDDLAPLAGYTVNGHFNNIVGRLHSLGLVEYFGRGVVGLSKMFD